MGCNIDWTLSVENEPRFRAHAVWVKVQQEWFSLLHANGYVSTGKGNDIEHRCVCCQSVGRYMVVTEPVASMPEVVGVCGKCGTLTIVDTQEMEIAP